VRRTMISSAVRSSAWAVRPMMLSAMRASEPAEARRSTRSAMPVRSVLSSSSSNSAPPEMRAISGSSTLSTSRWSGRMAWWKT